MLALALATALAAPTDLTWQGRLLDSDGAPLQGTHALTLTLHGHATANAPLAAPALVSAYVNDGYASVPLDGLASPLATASAAWLEIAVGGQVLAPRQPLGAVPYAIVASRVAAGPSPASATCDAIGAIAWDTGEGGLRVCDGSIWRLFLPDANGIALQDGARRWRDGTLADSCDAYRRPTDPGHEFTGTDAISGLYDISTSVGTLRVYCDMDRSDGGWTLVARLRSTSRDHVPAGAVGTLSSPTQAAAAKLSDAAIDAIRGELATSVMRLNCGASPDTFFRENKAFTAAAGGSGAMLACATSADAASFSASTPHEGHYGMNTWQQAACPYVIYSYASYNGCYYGGVNNNDGALWVR